MTASASSRDRHGRRGLTDGVQRVTEQGAPSSEPRIALEALRADMARTL
jgi:hypothetical protein